MTRQSLNHVPATFLAYAREMRRHPAPAELKLWYCLRKRLNGYKFHDGRQDYDQLRTNCINRNGVKVIRFTNPEVHEHLDAVLEEILRKCDAASANDSRPPSPLAGEGGGEG